MEKKGCGKEGGEECAEKREGGKNRAKRWSPPDTVVHVLFTELVKPLL